MRFKEVWAKVGPLPYTNEERCRRLYDLIFDNDLTRILELGIAHGKTLAVAAAAVEAQERAGLVVGIDLEIGARWFSPSAETTIANLGLLRTKPIIQREKVSYQWSLIQEIKRFTDNDLLVPIYDLIFLDGAHNVYHDVGAFFMAEMLLRPGGYLIIDDIPWVPAQGMTAPIIWGEDIREWSVEEQKTPHMRLIWEYLAKAHPNLIEFDNSDPWWGVCRKGSPINQPSSRCAR
jgi:predicted O-methyltransferase YrrM